MELITWSLLGLVLLVSSHLLTRKVTLARKLPPGPRGWPLIGCPWALFKDFHTLFSEIASTWGDVCSINILGKRIVSLNSIEMVREAFSSRAFGSTFSGRATAPPINDQVAYMTTFRQPGPLWSRQRKLLHKVLNYYGDGVEGTERTIQEEITHAVDYLHNAGETVDIDDVIYNSLINIMTIMLKGRRYDYDSPVLANTRVFEETGVQGASVDVTLLLTLLPFLKHIPVGPGKLVRDNTRSVKQFTADYFEESRATYKPHVTRGMIDFLIRHQEESRQEDGSSWLKDRSIKAMVQEAIAAGVMTTRGALYAFFLIIAHHAEVAMKIQNEIEAVVGRSRFPKLDDRPHMPYTMAAMFELLRYISHVPIGLPHETTDDVTFHGYFIPKHTTVIYNAWCFHHDEKTWPEPWTFRPERFLDGDGKLVPADHPNRKNTIPFGIGRRSCVGEAFAKSRMFLFITTLLQRFNFTADPARPLRSCDPRTYRPGIVLSPFQYWLKVTSRS